MDEYGFRDVGEMCGVCQKTFGEEEDLFSGLSRLEDKFERLDFCTSCWQNADQSVVFCFWKRKPRVKEAQPTVDGNVIFDIFQRLEGSEERHDQNFRYILALLLMRRKRLKFLDVERTEHGEYLVLEDRQIDDTKYRLLDPGMSHEEMQRAKEEVDKLFALNVDKEESEGGEESEDGERAEAEGAPEAETAVGAENVPSTEIRAPAEEPTAEGPPASEVPAEDVGPEAADPTEPAAPAENEGPAASIEVAATEELAGETVPSEEASDGQSVSEVHKS